MNRFSSQGERLKIVRESRIRAAPGRAPWTGRLPGAKYDLLGWSLVNYCEQSYTGSWHYFSDFVVWDGRWSTGVSHPIYRDHGKNLAQPFSQQLFFTTWGISSISRLRISPKKVPIKSREICGHFVYMHMTLYQCSREHCSSCGEKAKFFQPHT